MNIVLCFNKNWLKYIPVQFYALIKNNPNSHIYMISENLSYEDLKPFDEILKQINDMSFYTYINLEEHFDKYIHNDINTKSRCGKYTLARLFIPELIDENKIIYIDTDAICDKNLGSLWNFELKNNLIAGVSDNGVGDYKLTIGLNSQDVYINAGVILMNLEKIKQDKLQDKWYFMAQDQFRLGADQDIINISCKNRIIPIDLKYNVSLSTGLDISDEEIIIMHYAGIKNENWVKDLPKSHIWDKWEKEYNGIFRS